MSPREAWRRWLLAAGPWQGWAVCPALAATEVKPAPHASTRIVNPRLQLTHDLTLQLASLLANQPTLLLLDLDVCLGLQLAAELFRQAVAHPVLLIPRWPYEHAVLPVQPMLDTLLREAASLPRRHARLQSVAFVLDDQRGFSIPGRATDDPRADNRYRVSVADLPNLATLRARGISHVVKLTLDTRAQ